MHHLKTYANPKNWRIISCENLSLYYLLIDTKCKIRSRKYFDDRLRNIHTKTIKQWRNAHLIVLKYLKDFESTRICKSEWHFQKNSTESYKNNLTTEIKYCHAPINQTVQSVMKGYVTLWLLIINIIKLYVIECLIYISFNSLLFLPHRLM